MAKLFLLGLMAVSVLTDEYSQYAIDGDYGNDYIVHGKDAKKNGYPWQGEISIKIISDKCCLSFVHFSLP